MALECIHRSLPRLREEGEGERDGEELARVGGQHGARAAPRARERDEAAHAHPRGGAVQHEPMYIYVNLYIHMLTYIC